MLLTFTLIILTILFITFRKRIKENFSWSVETAWDVSLMSLLIIDMIACLILLFYNFFLYDFNKTAFQERYSAIQTAIKNDNYDGHCADMVYKYNAQVKFAKKHRDNIWIGWFCDRAAAEQEIIELESSD